MNIKFAFVGWESVFAGSIDGRWSKYRAYLSQMNEWFGRRSVYKAIHLRFPRRWEEDSGSHAVLGVLSLPPYPSLCAGAAGAT